MNLNQRIIFSLLALLPGIILCIYIYFKDRVEKEPIGLLAILFGAGAVSFVPAYFLSEPINSLLIKIFGQNVQYFLGIPQYSSVSIGLLYEFVSSFFATVLVEEILRFLLLYFITSRLKEFDCLFDGIVYSVFISLGFSVVETIRFTIYNGWDMLVSQMLTATGHILFGIVMGFFYTLWHIYALAAKEEKKQIGAGVLTERKIHSPALLVVLSVLIPVILHTMSEFSSNYYTQFLAPWIQPVYYILLAITYIICFVATIMFSKRDAENASAVVSILKRKHPDFDAKKEDK